VTCDRAGSDLRTLPEGVLDAAAVAVGGSLALMGGTSPKATSTGTVYTLRVDGKGEVADWTRATTLQVGRSRFGAINFPGSTGSSILVLGGLNEPTAEVYSEFGGSKGAVVRMGLPGGDEGAWNQVKAVHLSSGVGQVCAVGEVGGKGVAAASVRILITCLNCDNLVVCLAPFSSFALFHPFPGSSLFIFFIFFLSHVSTFSSLNSRLPHRSSLGHRPSPLPPTAHTNNQHRELTSDEEPT
jgi:hypothetical protein